MTRPGKLLDAAGIMREYGVSRTVADRWKRQLPKVKNPGGVDKEYVFRADVEQLVADAVVDVVTAEARGRRNAA